MIRFDITYGPDGGHTATHADVTKSGSDPVRSIARDLVDAGVPDQPWETGVPGRTDMRGPSLHLLAASNLSEGDHGFTRGWYARHPRSEPRPVLEAVVARLKAEAAARRGALRGRTAIAASRVPECPEPSEAVLGVPGGRGAARHVGGEVFEP